MPDETTLFDLRQQLIAEMSAPLGTDAGESLDSGYTQEHVNRFAEIIDNYLASLQSEPVPDAESIMAIVEETVLSLNDLEQDTGGVLIGESRREKLRELILAAAQSAGLQTDEDVTETWREW